MICPICGSTSGFSAFGNSIFKRKNARCKSCGSLERHRLLNLVLVKKFDYFLKDKSSFILHTSPRSCISRMFKDHKNYFSTKDSPLYVNLDLTSNISRNGEIFDMIICIHVLEHIMEDRKALKGIFGLLKLGGFAFVGVPIRKGGTLEDMSLDFKERHIKYGSGEHVRYYGLDIKNRIEEAGFKVEVVGPEDIADLEETKKFGLINEKIEEYIFCCCKI